MSWLGPGALLVFVVMLFGKAVHAGPMGTAGQFEVSPTGAATYTIPIQVPPGTAGIEPKLSLVYNSQTGNGLLGVGWSLSGLSAITRCPRTVAQDGVRGSVNFDMDDRYCLDGQRLVAVNGPYGADGTEYRTERDSFSRVVGYGMAGNGSAWFKAWTKAGLIIEYGSSDDSRIEVQGSSTVRSWAMNRLSDIAGNYLAIRYDENSSTGEYYPVRIDYAGSLSAAPDKSVQFFYDQRSDVYPLFYQGTVTQIAKRLIGVQSYTGTRLSMDYRLAYESSALVPRSRIRSISQCDANGICSAPVSVSWSDAVVGFAPPSVWVKHGDTFTSGQAQYADVNGDGLPDLIFQGNDNAFYVSLSMGNSLSSPMQWMKHGGSFVPGQARYADANGDGLADLIFQGNDNTFYISLSTGSSFGSPMRWMKHGGSFVGGQAQYADVNGDGLPDLIFQGDDNSFYVSFSTGSAFSSPTRWVKHGGSFIAGQAQYADVNGDGLPDLIFQGNDNAFYVSLSTGSNFTSPMLWMQHGGSFVAGHAQYADVNGDGLADLIFQGNDNAFYVSLSTGTSFSSAAQWMKHGGTFTEGQAAYVDVNGDGLADLVFQGYNNEFYVSLSNGSSFSNPILWMQHGGTFSAGHAAYPDINGDGLPDLMYQGYSNEFYSLPAVGVIPNRAETFTSLGNTTAVVFKPLTNPATYSKGAGASYPVQDIQPPTYVVSQAQTSNGIGGTMTSSYSYGGLRVELGTGRGLLGFGWLQAANIDTGVVSRTEYHQDWPYAGLPSLVKKTSSSGGNDGLVSQTTYTYDCLNPQLGSACTVAAGNVYFPYVAQSIESARDLNGAALPTVTTTNAFDGYGNTTQVSVTSSDGFSKTTSNTYTNDTTNWHLGRLLRSQVQSVAP